MFPIIVGAAVLGIIIAVMEEGDFPGWGTTIICVLAAGIPAQIVNSFLPDGLFFVGFIVGAITAGFAISATCGMSVKRACIAAGIYFAVQMGISLFFLFVLA